MKRFSSISEFLQYRNMPKPAHPLIAAIEVSSVERMKVTEPISWCYDFYAIGLKRVANAKDVQLKYGQQTYDFNEGVMSFIAPGQVLSFSFDAEAKEIIQSGWMLLIHPDFLWSTSLAKNIRQYDFWDYSVNEALFLSAKEEAILIRIIEIIAQESHANIDKFSKSIITSHLETLLNYADRFYHRQFITREKSGHQILERLEVALEAAFNSENIDTNGLPTVASVAQSLHLSPKYLSSLLKVLTGQNTQQHIHGKMIEKAKEKLSTTQLSISEIAYELGFEHLQSFSKFFKAKTNFSPMEFKALFN